MVDLWSSGDRIRIRAEFGIFSQTGSASRENRSKTSSESTFWSSLCYNEAGERRRSSLLAMFLASSLAGSGSSLSVVTVHWVARVNRSAWSWVRFTSIKIRILICKSEKWCFFLALHWNSKRSAFKKRFFKNWIKNDERSVKSKIKTRKYCIFGV